VNDKIARLAELQIDREAATEGRSRWSLIVLAFLGFGPFSILSATIVESAVLAVLGGILGGGLAWLFLNGYTVSTLNGASFSQVVFDFAVSLDLLAQGLIGAVIIGLVGGLFPAIRAVRIPVSAALREL